jgi:peptidoglycan/LPS O-acetylase OafA/YrhL
LYIPSLDGLRAVAFMIVFAAHSGFEIVPGGFGVTVFFFLSGYLIATLLRIEIEQTGTVGLRGFYLRRVLRILPPFYVVLAAAVLASLLGLLPGTIETVPVLAQVFHVANYWQIFQTADGQPSGTGVYWSLAVEEHFYLVFPLLYLLSYRRFASRGARAAALLVGCLAVLCWRAALVYVSGAPPDYTYMATDARLDSILFGCVLATFANPALDDAGRPASLLWKALLLPAGIGVLLLTFLYRDPGFRETLRYTLQGLALFPVFVVAVRDPEWGPFRLLNLAWVKFVGVLSYSLYLTHQVVLFAIGHATRLGIVGRAVLALIISLLVAYAIRRLVELPCARLRRRISGSVREELPVPAAAAERSVTVEPVRP